MSLFLPSRLASVASWAVGAVFVLSGVMKLVSLPAAVELFAAFRLPAWTLPAVGTYELVAAGLLLVRRTRSYGAIAIGLDMIGASLAHVLTGIEQEMLLLDVGFLAIAAWLTLREIPPFFRPDWAHDPHRHEPVVRSREP